VSDDWPYQLSPDRLAQFLIEIYQHSGEGDLMLGSEYKTPLMDFGFIDNVPAKLFPGQFVSGITEKGIEAAQMLLGVRSTSQFAMPSWLLKLVTR
jgi:hypothetical protein